MATREQLMEWVRDARQRTFDVVADLLDEQLIVPKMPILNPLLWELSHVAWFQEKWILRHVGRQAPIRPDVDSLFDSAAVAPAVRWDLTYPNRRETLAYLELVRDRVLEQLDQAEPDPDTIYFTRLSVFHEDMHTEAFTYMRQTLCYRAPPFDVAKSALEASRERQRPESLGDADIPGGPFDLGATPDEPFVFDNEKWAHPVEVRPFRIAKTAVTQAEFAAFVDDGGYRERRHWSDAGWTWREQAAAEHPVYWEREAAGRWLRRDFDQWTPLEPNRPVIHVNWFEAEAYCHWAGRRLPSESEWEMAAAGGTGQVKRRFPWGETDPTPPQANLDWTAMGCIDVAALPDGDSIHGCRQMIGNVWEWTASDFLPYPGFVVDPYKEYSAPWFGPRKVLRGGAWATRSRLLRNTWRNFFTPARRDILAGFRTCAV